MSSQPALAAATKRKRKTPMELAREQKRRRAAEAAAAVAVADLALGALLHELRQRLLHVRERHLALAGECRLREKNEGSANCARPPCAPFSS